MAIVDGFAVVSEDLAEGNVTNLAVSALLAIGPVHACGQGRLVDITPALLSFLLADPGIFHQKLVRL
jgi:hypothetical protein